MRSLADELRQRVEALRVGLRAGPRTADVSGRKPARARIAQLLDRDSSFLELSPLAAWGLHGGAAPAAGIVTGIGRIHGAACMVIANDWEVKGGTYFPETVKKHLRAQEVAQQNRLPCFYLVDSGGAFLPLQAEVFPDRWHFGRIFYNQARMSAEGIPQVSVVFGPSTAGGAYVPAMSEETILLRGSGAIYLGGPPLVRAATGEEVSSQELGGSEVHCRISGLADHEAADEDDAIAEARRIGAELALASEAADVGRVFRPPHAPAEPDRPSTDLYDLVPVSPRKPYDVHGVLECIADGGSLREFKALYGPTLVTSFARIWGFPVGIIASNGILFSESALKGTHFIGLCQARGAPLVFLQNISGFMVGRQYEAGGIAKDGAKMVHAVATASVPRLTVVIGGSFGAGNYAMCGRAYDPRFLWMWPNARISVMGADQAADVLATVKEEQLRRKGASLSAEERAAIREPILEKYEEEGSAYYSTARLWDDGIIDPAETRSYLGLALSIVAGRGQGPGPRGVLRM